jgi:hypothetical protein
MRGCRQGSGRKRRVKNHMHKGTRAARNWREAHLSAEVAAPQKALRDRTLKLANRPTMWAAAACHSRGKSLSWRQARTVRHRRGRIATLTCVARGAKRLRPSCIRHPTSRWQSGKTLQRSTQDTPPPSTECPNGLRTDGSPVWGRRRLHAYQTIVFGYETPISAKAQMQILAPQSRAEEYKPNCGGTRTHLAAVIRVA